MTDHNKSYIDRDKNGNIIAIGWDENKPLKLGDKMKVIPMDKTTDENGNPFWTFFDSHTGEILGDKYPDYVTALVHAKKYITDQLNDGKLPTCIIKLGEHTELNDKQQHLTALFADVKTLGESIKHELHLPNCNVPNFTNIELDEITDKMVMSKAQIQNAITLIQSISRWP